MKILLLFSMLLFGCEKVNQLNEQEGTLEVEVNIKLLCGNVPVGANNTGNPCGYTNELMDEIYGRYSVEIKSKENKFATKKTKLKKLGKISELVPYGEYTISVYLDAKSNSQSISEKNIKIIGSEKAVVKIDIDAGMQ